MPSRQQEFHVVCSFPTRREVEFSLNAAVECRQSTTTWLGCLVVPCNTEPVAERGKVETRTKLEAGPAHCQLLNDCGAAQAVCWRARAGVGAAFVSQHHAWPGMGLC
jgi:hypothetical protein